MCIRDRYEGNDWYACEVLSVTVLQNDDEDVEPSEEIVTIEAAFLDGDYEKELALEGERRHAFLRANDEGKASLAPLLQSVRSKAELKKALWQRSPSFFQRRGSMVAAAPLLLIPDVSCFAAFDAEQVSNQRFHPVPLLPLNCHRIASEPCVFVSRT
eukprot:4113572-Prymnesium_polylepis.1